MGLLNQLDNDPDVQAIGDTLAGLPTFAFDQVPPAEQIETLRVVNTATLGLLEAAVKHLDQITLALAIVVKDLNERVAALEGQGT
jgi:hypothetical protein